MRRILIPVLLLTACRSAADPAPAPSGEEAIPALRNVLTDPKAPPDRVKQAAADLGSIRLRTGSAAALHAYFDSLADAPSDDHLRAMLGYAYRFRASEGVFLALDRALKNLGTVTPEMVASAGALTDVEALETMMRVVGRDVESPSSPQR